MYGVGKRAGGQAGRLAGTETPGPDGNLTTLKVTNHIYLAYLPTYLPTYQACNWLPWADSSSTPVPGKS